MAFVLWHVRHTSTITQINPLLALTDVTIETSKPGLPEQLLSSALKLGVPKGILIVQCSQIITILGGPARCLLFSTPILQRLLNTRNLLVLWGSCRGFSFLGTSSAYLARRLISDHYGIIAPFRTVREKANRYQWLRSVEEKMNTC
jgi:hypothetical protein